MRRHKAAVPAASASSSGKHSEIPISTQSFIWKPQDWSIFNTLTEDVSVYQNTTTRGRLVVKKVVRITSNQNGDLQPYEIRAVADLPNSNRVVKPLFYYRDPGSLANGIVIYPYFELGDLTKWKEMSFDEKNHKPVPESHIWRFFLQMSQALAFIQNQLGPGRDERDCLIHRDIKPKNILVAHNGSTYPSFLLHDFGCAIVHQREKARQGSRCGTYEWQPPENPTINTTATEIWALGACVHYLAVGDAPLSSISLFRHAQIEANKGRHPLGANDYNTPARYYAARVPRLPRPINLSRQEQEHRGLAPRTNLQRAPYVHQYSDELDEWMMQCLQTRPGMRPGVDRLIHGMGIVARGMLKQMGGRAALTDIDVDFR